MKCSVISKKRRNRLFAWPDNQIAVGKMEIFLAHGYSWNQGEYVYNYDCSVFDNDDDWELAYTSFLSFLCREVPASVFLTLMVGTFLLCLVSACNIIYLHTERGNCHENEKTFYSCRNVIGSVFIGL